MSKIYDNKLSQFVPLVPSSILNDIQIEKTTKRPTGSTIEESLNHPIQR